MRIRLIAAATACLVTSPPAAEAQIARCLAIETTLDRLGTEKAQTRAFRESNNNMALGLWDGGQAIPFIRQMLSHDRMIVRATPFSDSTVTAEYRISGLAGAVAPLREACNW